MTSPTIDDPTTATGRPGDAGRGRWFGLAMLSLGRGDDHRRRDDRERQRPVDHPRAGTRRDRRRVGQLDLLARLRRPCSSPSAASATSSGAGRCTSAAWSCSCSPPLLAGLAPTGEILILARLFQGVGGAMILPSTQSILNTNFRGRERAIAFGIWGSVIGGDGRPGAAPRRLADHLPVLALGLLHQHPDRHPRRRRDAALHPGVARPVRPRGFDPLGFVLITFGLGRRSCSA